jgi:hypothetical protein
MVGELDHLGMRCTWNLYVSNASGIILQRHIPEEAAVIRRSLIPNSCRAPLKHSSSAGSSGKGEMGLFSVMNISTSGNLSYPAKPRPHIGEPECLSGAKKLLMIGVDYSISR